MSTQDFSSGFEALEQQDFALGNAEDRERLNYLGSAKQSWPIDVRILVNISSKDEAKPLHENHFHEYIVNDQYVRVPCLKALGEPCPVCDAYWRAYEELKTLEDEGAKNESNPKHEQFLRTQILAKRFQQKKRYSVLVSLRGDDKVSVLETKPQLTKAIFGDNYKKTKGAIDEIKSYGAPVYNPAEPTGWLTLNKTGTGLSTVYTAKPTMNTKINGRKKSEELVEEELHPTVLAMFNDMEKLPKLSKIIKSRAWSLEDLENFVASDGLQLPQREVERLAKYGKKSGGASETPKPAPSETVDFNDSSSFDPF